MPFWRKKKPKPVDLTGDEPRFHHYALAHFAFREIAHHNPLMFFGALSSPEKENFINAVLESIEGDNKAQETLDFSPSDFEIYTERAADFPFLLMTFPEPERMAEAYFIGVVMKVNPDQEPSEEHPPEVDYFTLEKGMNLDGSDRTVFCSWSKEGSHMNFGDGPPADVAAFRALVTGQYEGT